jgi:hypothetical protein
VALETEREKDREMLAHAAMLRAPLARAAKLAVSNGTGYVVFGVGTALFSLSTAVADLIALGVAAALIYVGASARRLGPRLARGEADAARALARNELVLLGAIAIYCLLMVTVVRPTSAELDDLLRSANMTLDTSGLARAVYAVVFAVALLY